MDCRVTIQHRNRLLQDGLWKATGSWRYLVAGRDPDNNCTVDEIIALRNKALILLRSYKIALEKMDKPLRWTYKQCCIKACSELNSLGINETQSWKTVQIYNKLFRTHTVHFRIQTLTFEADESHSRHF
jgi:hypothetical protein